MILYCLLRDIDVNQRSSKMRKTLIFCMLNFTILSTAHANPQENYDKALDEWARSYPVIQQLKKDRLFKSVSNTVLNLPKNSNRDPQEIFEQVIDRVLPFYIHGGPFEITEKLEPVYRDLKGMEPRVPVLPTVGENSLYTVKNIFGRKLQK